MSTVKKPMKKAQDGRSVVKGTRKGLGAFRTEKERTSAGGVFEPYKYKRTSVDTTGYSKGRKNYQLKTEEGEGDKTGSKATSRSSKTISRKEVPSTLKSLNKAKDGKWMQKAAASIKKRGTKGVCTGAKFGGPTCKPGSKRYALAKTFKSVAKKKK